MHITLRKIAARISCGKRSLVLIDLVLILRIQNYEYEVFSGSYDSVSRHLQAHAHFARYMRRSYGRVAETALKLTGLFCDKETLQAQKQ
jgi:hypothetical protein